MFTCSVWSASFLFSRWCPF